MDNQSIQHTRWNCMYHLVFIPKYRKEVLYGTNKKDLQEIIPKLCEMKHVELIEGKVCKDHIHMYVAILPKMSVSEFMSYLKARVRLCFMIDIQNFTQSGEKSICGQEGIMSAL